MFVRYGAPEKVICTNMSGCVIAFISLACYRPIEDAFSVLLGSTVNPSVPLRENDHLFGEESIKLPVDCLSDATLTISVRSRHTWSSYLYFSRKMYQSIRL